MGLKNISPRYHGLMPPGSPTEDTAIRQAAMENINDLFDVLEKGPNYLTNQEPPNTPVLPGYSEPCPDMVLLEHLLLNLIHDESSFLESSAATRPTQQEEVAQAADELDLYHPIHTTPNDFDLFLKWLSKTQFHKVAQV